MVSVWDLGCLPVISLWSLISGIRKIGHNILESHIQLIEVHCPFHITFPENPWNNHNTFKDPRQRLASVIQAKTLGCTQSLSLRYQATWKSILLKLMEQVTFIISPGKRFKINVIQCIYSLKYPSVTPWYISYNWLLWDLVFLNGHFNLSFNCFWYCYDYHLPQSVPLLQPSPALVHSRSPQYPCA